MKKILYFLSFLLLLTSCSGKKDDKTISIGYINWDSGANGRLITVPTESAIMSFMNCANMWELMRCM